ncbi:hypothetical protein GCM10018785_17640 [Streptomyces longispororuber]|uniref:Uncharacterized protein n=1 Tax=Streptomyces longispororuber TaxID=68230 RepID=A0A919DIS7_9ACTN|nr:hypothetical protein GCM10018785_17640 [Streptomyces longispororuber]
MLGRLFGVRGGDGFTGEGSRGERHGYECGQQKAHVKRSFRELSEREHQTPRQTASAVHPADEKRVRTEHHPCFTDAPFEPAVRGN